jgi:hypothetical protein
MSAPKLPISSTADLIAAVPYLIGFHPGNGSLVAIATADHRVVLALRAELGESGDAPRGIELLGAQLVQVIAQQRSVTEVTLIGYGTRNHVDHHLLRLAETVSRALPVEQLLRVTADRFFGVGCDTEDCCPPQGRPVDLKTSVVAVHATVAGLVALPDRDAVAATIAPVPGAAREAMRHATQTACTRLATLIASGEDVTRAGSNAIRDALACHDRGQPPTDVEAAWLTVLLARRQVRDAAIFLTRADRQHVTFWADITRRAQGPLAAGPAVLLAFAAWRCGNGGFALMALERALEAEPEYHLAGLVLRGLQAGVPAEAVEQMITDNAGPGPAGQ